MAEILKKEARKGSASKSTSCCSRAFVWLTRCISPFSRKSRPPSSATPLPTIAGLSFSTSVTDGMRKTNERLNEEVHRLRAQVESLRQRCELQEIELQKSTRRAQEAAELAAKESAKSKTAKEVIKSLTAQLKYANNLKRSLLPNGLEPNGMHYSSTIGSSDSVDGSGFSSEEEHTAVSVVKSSDGVSRDLSGCNETNAFHQRQGLLSSYRNECHDAELPNNSGVVNRVDASGPEPAHVGDTGTRSRNSSLACSSIRVDTEWVEQYEPGVYITLMAVGDGTRDLKRVRFSRRRFGERQAETWWCKNRERVHQRYNIRRPNKSLASGRSGR